MTNPSNLPPGCPDPGDVPEMVTCPQCDGEGYDKEGDILSNCCGANIPQYPDFDICGECKDHCQPQECYLCEGIKEVTQQEYDLYKEEEKADTEANN